jgi:hypothetical protein
VTALVWDDTGNRRFETGVEKAVLYPLNSSTSAYDTGVAWNGITQVAEKPSGASSNPQYADNIKYLDLYSVETFAGTIQALTYPDEFGACDGTASPQPGITIGQQPRQKFGLCYRTKIGNDVSSDAGYKLHLVWGAVASPSEKDYATINDSPSPVAFSWDFTTTPVNITGHEPVSLMVIDSTTVDPTDLASLEAVLYGNSAAASLPLPDAVLAIFSGT